MHDNQSQVKITPTLTDGVRHGISKGTKIRCNSHWNGPIWTSTGHPSRWDAGVRNVPEAEVSLGIFNGS